jgi:hypothetical protein
VPRQPVDLYPEVSSGVVGLSPFSPPELKVARSNRAGRTILLDELARIWSVEVSWHPRILARGGTLMDTLRDTVHAPGGSASIRTRFRAAEAGA